MRATHFQQVSEFYPRLPRFLWAELRRVVDAPSEKDTFSCCCNLLEGLTLYLDSLCNSVYLDRASDRVDEKLDAELRKFPTVLSFGRKVEGLRALARSRADLEEKLPALARIVIGKELPPLCVRTFKSFVIIREARDSFEVPPHAVHKYLDARISGDDKALSKASIHDFLSEMVTFRNRGIGHPSDDDWFPQDASFYQLLNELLLPALDALLAWEPMQAILTAYEVVQVDSRELSRGAGTREPPVERPHVVDGSLPLVPSRLRLKPGQPAEGFYVAQRTGDTNALAAVVRYLPFPRTLQSNERLYQQYRREYLMAYLDRGVITPSQRQDELQALASKFSFPAEKLKIMERELQTLVDDYSGAAAGANGEASVQELQRLLGPEWTSVQERVLTLLELLPTRRKDYIFQIIADNVLISFAQLKAESELSEPDLEAVLEELEEQDRTIGRVGGGLYRGRSQAHFKVHDHQKPRSLTTLLDELRQTAPGHRKQPEMVWRLVLLCHSLLIDNGFPFPRSELDAYRTLFDVDAPERAAAATAQEADDASILILRVNDSEIRAPSVQRLLPYVWQEVQRQRIDASRAIPFAIGKTRYLVNRRPVHADGSAFAAPIALGDVFFEGALTRAQALNESIRFLSQLGAVALSPNIEVEYSDDGEQALESTSAEPEGWGVGIEIHGPGGSLPIRGSTVRKFYTNLLTHLIERGCDLSAIAPAHYGRVRYLLAEEPYHANGRRFQAIVSKAGYFMEASLTHAQAVDYALDLCEKLGLHAAPLVTQGTGRDGVEAVPLETEIAGRKIEGDTVPKFLRAALTALYEEGLLTEADIPYKSGRVSYLISATGRHAHGREFKRSISVKLGGNEYFVEANMTRIGALEMVQRLIATKMVPV